MKLWCHLPTIINRRSALRTAGLLSLIVALTTTVFFGNSAPSYAVAGINKTVNFQGRLLDASGGVVPDGYYNIQFKIYQDGSGQLANDAVDGAIPAGTLKWTETYVNNNAPTTNGVLVKNGFLSVNLGSKTAFGTSVDWNQDTIWLSMNVAGSATACTTFGSSPCTADGEMLPMRRMTASPYALNSGLLGGLSASNFIQMAQGVQTDANGGATINVNKTGTGDLINFQNAGTQVFNVNQTGDITFGSATSHNIGVTQSAAGAAGQGLTIAAGQGGTGTGFVGGNLNLQGGAGGGTTAAGGSVTIDAGAATGGAYNGGVNIGVVQASGVYIASSNTADIQIGNSSVGSSLNQKINIGNNNGAGNSTVVVGSGSQSANGIAAGTTAIQSKGVTTVTTNGVQRATFDSSANLFLGSGVTGATGNYTIQGTGGNAASIVGSSLTVQGGTGGSGAAGGDLLLQGGTAGSGSVQGQVKIGAAGFSTTTIAAYGTSSTIAQSAVDTYSSVSISASTTGLTITVPAPTTKYDGRVLYVQLTGSNSITLSPNGGSNTSMSPNSVYALVWNTTKNGWLAAGTDSNGFIQNQNATDQVANFRINGVGQANTGFLAPSLDVVSAGTLSIGTNATTVATTIQIGSATLASGSQTINIGNNNTAGSTTNVVIGAGGSATGGTTQIQSKGNTTIATNGTTRATFDTSNSLYLGAGVTSGTQTTFTVQGTGGTAGGTVAGSNLTIQGGGGSTGGAGGVGGTLRLQGGAGGGTTANGGDIIIDGGAASGSALGGAVSIGTTNARAVTVGSTSVGSSTTTVQANSAVYIGVGSTNTTRAIFDASNFLYLGGTCGFGTCSTQSDFQIQGTGNTAGQGGALSVVAGASGATNGIGGALSLQSGNKGSGGTDGAINIGTLNNANVTVGAANIATGVTQTITIGGASAGAGTQNVVVGSTSGAAAGSTTIQSKVNTTIATNGTTRATFDNGAANNGKLYLGDGLTSTGTGAQTFTLQGSTGAASQTGFALALQGGTGGSGGGSVGGGVTIQGGTAGGTNANGGDVTLQGGTKAGTGVLGQVKIGSASGYTTAGNQNFTATGQGVTQANVDNYTAIDISANAAGYTEAIPAPTTKYSGRLLYLQITGSNSITLNPTNGTSILMNPNTAVTLIWNTTIGGTGGWLNAGADSGSNSYIQNQNTADQTANFRINGTAQSASVATASIDNATSGAGNGTSLSIGATNARTIGLGNSTAATAVTIQGGTGTGAVGIQAGTSGTISVGTAAANTVTIGSGTAATTVSLTGGNTSSAVSIQAATSGTISLGTANANTVNIGNTTAATAVSIQGGTGSTAVAIQTGTGGTMNIGTANASTINIGTYSASGTTNVTIGSAGGATAGTTRIQSKNNTVISTDNGSGTMLDRVTVGSGTANGTLSVGNGSTNGSPVSLFTIQATSGVGTNIAGTALTVQAGNSTGTANGANLTLSGGSSANNVSGLVVLNTPTFQTYNSGTAVSCPGPSTCAITSPTVDNNAVIVVNAQVNAMTVTLPNPSITGPSAYGRILYITGDYASQNFTLSINGGGNVSNLISMRASASATLVWGPGNSGAGAWTAAGASSSTTLQAAYDNTIQSSGGAELIVSKTSNTNGLTIRDSATNSVNGALMSVQSSSAANLFSVNSNVTEYAQNPGAELYDTTTPNLNAFPNSVWANGGTASTISRNTTSASVATGQGSVSVAIPAATAGAGVRNTLSAQLNTGLTYNVSFSAILGSGSFSDMKVDYSTDGTTTNATTSCTNSTQSNYQIFTKSWTKVTCAFTVPSGANSSNAIWIRQTAGAIRTFYIDNLSVTAASSQSYVTDGGVDNTGSFSTNWVAVGGSAAQSTSNGNDASSSAQVTTTSSATSGIKNKLAVSPLPSVGTTTIYNYRVTAYVQTTSTALTAFKIRYLRDNNTNYVDCVDYNQQSVAVSTTAWQKITCIIQTDTVAPTNPYLVFEQGDTTVRSGTLYIDTVSMTLANSTTPNVQIGSGKNGGPTTLFTLDSGTAPPIAADNQSLLGSMYYDTSIGKIQCYQAAGWGSCGSAPDTVVTIAPEYTNAVFHGNGVGTLTSDLCSFSLSINYNGGTSYCASGETYNFYKWTSPQPTSQTYSIYVSYQLPSTFRAFTSGQTSVTGRIDSASNASASYKVYRNPTSNVSGGALAQCGSGSVTIASSANTWTKSPATGTADPSTCSFVASDTIVIVITLGSNTNANAFVSNIGFTFSNR